MTMIQIKDFCEGGRVKWKQRMGKGQREMYVGNSDQ